MIVLQPLFPGEELWSCTQCSHIGLRSPIMKRSSFLRFGKGWRKNCRRCLARRESERRALTMTPEKRAEKRAYQREWRAKRAQDPDFVKRHRAACARTKKKAREMRGAKAIREEGRIDYALRQERQGRKLKLVECDSRGKATVHYPAEPFVTWLKSLIKAEERAGHTDARQRVERLLQISSRRFSDWLVAKEVTEKQVDYACSRHGGVSIFDIYPEGADTVTPEAADDASGISRARKCSDRDCNEEAHWLVHAKKERLGKNQIRSIISVVEDHVAGRSCFEHAERLARLRIELEDEGTLMSINGGAPLAATKRKRAKAPTCCNPNCWNEREVGERFCEGCVEAGFREETE